MKAAAYTGNKTLQLAPSEQISPADNEVRLEVAYCGICGTDMHIYHGNMDQRVRMPQIIGHEVSAVVAEVGAGVADVQVGDRVCVRPLKFGEAANFDRGNAHVGKNLRIIGIDMPGGMQSSWTVPAYTLHKIPDELNLETAALIEPLAVAVHDVKLSRLKGNETCVVIGGGPIGLLIAMVARNLGARVILSEINESRLTLARELGLEAVNPLEENLADSVAELTEGAMADCVFEVSGSAVGVQVMTDLVCARGRIVVVAIHPDAKPVNLFKFFWSEIQMIGARLYEAEDFDDAIQLAASGQLALKKLITKVSTLENVAEVFETIDSQPDGIKYLIKCNET